VTTKASAPEFGKLRTLLWPIHGFEMQKFIPMFLMFFFISFNYSVLRIVKDSLIINAPGSGAQALPFLKLWGTTPAAVLFMIAYVKLSTLLSRKNLFYASLLPFLGFFLLFPLVLNPFTDMIHPTTSADWLLSVLPEGLSGFVAVYRNWSYSLLYVFAELFGSVVLSTLFWGFANETTRVSEAKRFYGLLLIGANLALVFVFPFVKFTNSLGDFSTSINTITLIAAVNCMIVAGLYWLLNEKILVKPQFANTDAKKPTKKKEKLGFIASIGELAKSRYLALLALMVLAYGVSINLVEVSWKHYLKVLFAGDKSAFLEFQGRFMTFTGWTTMILLYLGTGNIVRRFGWGVTALITPVLMFLTSLLFFGNITFEHIFMGLLVSFGTTPLWIAAIIGGIQNVLSKSAKYAFFDSTKEMAYIPLDDQTRRTGKAAIDGVGGRLGKSGGAVINMVLIGVLGSIEAITPYVAIITIAIIGVWILCAIALNKKFVALTKQQEIDSAS
jgi:AAA family ATP:ADP antiporter